MYNSNYTKEMNSKEEIVQLEINWFVNYNLVKYKIMIIILKIIYENQV
jgi:hypothetical protein